VLRATIERATLWSAVEVGGRSISQFIVTIFLARLLSPRDFGIVAIALFFSAIVTLVVQTTIVTTLVRAPKSSREEESSLHWLNIALSLGLACVFLLAGPIIAGLFNLPLLAPLMIAVALQVGIGSIGTIPGAIMIRAMRFRELAIIGLVANLAGGVFGILLAIQGFGPWALAWQVTIATVGNAIGCVVGSGWWPKAHFRIGSVLHHLHFSGWLGLSSLLELLYLQASTLLIGKFYGPTPLGLYGRASSLQLLTANLVQGIIGRIALLVFASRQAEPQELRAALLKSIHLVMFAFVPVMVGIAICAEEVLLVLFGGQWGAAAPLLTILALGGAFYPIQLLNEQILLAQGFSDSVFRLSVLRKIVGIGCILTGSLAGLIGLAWGQSAALALGSILAMSTTGRIAGYGIIAQLGQMWQPLAATAAMSGILLVARHSLVLAPHLELLAMVTLGSLVYLGTAALLRTPALSELRLSFLIPPLVKR
jgi:teichuronic acid exporter